MTRDPDLTDLAPHDTSTAAQRQRPSGLATGLAAAMPFLVGVASTAIFSVGLGRESAVRFMQETGWPFYAILLATWLSALVLTITLVLAGRGARVPAAVSLFFAGLPWVVGVAGVRISTSAAIQAVQYADAASRATMMAQGFSEASGARLLGAWCTSALAGALALGLAIAALGQRSTNRKPLFGAVGLALALPVLALAGYAILARAFDAFAIYGVVAALGVLAALTLAGAGAGDSPHGRAAALAASVAPVALLSFVAAIAAMETGGFRGAFSAVANADPSQRTMMLAIGADAFIVGGRLTNLAMAALGLAALVLAGWAASRARPSLGRVVGGVALGLVVLLVVGTDLAADLATAHDIAELELTAWQGVDGFTPATILGSSDYRREDPIATVTVDAILPRGRPPIPLSALTTPAGAATLTEALRAAQARADEHTAPDEEGDRPEWLRERGGSGDPGTPADDDRHVGFLGARPEPEVRPSMTLAIDARVPASVLRAVFEAARGAGAHSLVLVGTGQRMRPGALERLQREAPLVAMVAQPMGSVRVLLESALSPGYADADPLLWHTTVTRRSSSELTPRQGADRETITVDGEASRDHYDDGDGEPHAVAYLALADDATSDSLAGIAVAATQRSLQPLVVLGAMPGRPESAVAPTGTGEVEQGYGVGPGIGLGGLGSRGTGGFGAGPNDSAAGYRNRPVPAPNVRIGNADIRGSLSRDVIRRVIQQHISEARYCYEHGLADHPELEGRVSVQFVVSPTGAVQMAAVSASSMGSPTVEACLAAAVQLWSFPAPEGGGIVVVNYPFVFTAEPRP